MWTVQKLKRDLSSRGASTLGRKQNLVERLEPYDRNFDFKPDPIILPQSVPTKCWISATFGDYAQGSSSKDVNGAD
uniref:SAP domain-containing protein n=1 Tax=Magallana gigas TaxID=29159 RepID=A0A8W8MH66_MAGGI